MYASKCLCVPQLSTIDNKFCLQISLGCRYLMQWLFFSIFFSMPYSDFGLLKICQLKVYPYLKAYVRQVYRLIDTKLCMHVVASTSSRYLLFFSKFVSCLRFLSWLNTYMRCIYHPIDTKFVMLFVEVCRYIILNLGFRFSSFI